MELIHTCYRIGEIDRSVEFYEALGFEERRRAPIRDEAINVFMGLPGDGDRLELTYNFGVDSYELGTGYNHIALAVIDLGSNSFRLVVFSYAEPDETGRAWWRRTDEIHEAVRIAAGQDEDGTLAEEPMERALETLEL